MAERKAGAMMNICSSSGTSFFNSAIDYLERFDKETEDELDYQIDLLKMGIHLLGTIDLYIRKCRRRGRSSQGGAKFDSLRLSSISFQIQDLVREITHGIDSIGSDLGDAASMMMGFEKDMNLFFETDIKKLDIMSLLVDYSLGDLQLLIDFVDSVSFGLGSLLIRLSAGAVMETLQEKLMLLKSFIRFAMVQGVDGQPMIKLLDHVEIVAVNAASLSCTSWFQRWDEGVRNKMVSEVSQLIYKTIDPINLQAREIYTHVLEASKLSRSSHTLAPKKYTHLVVEFIYYVLQSTMGIISECYASFLVKVKDQMLQLLEGVKFICIILRLQQENFYELNDAMKDCIEVVVSDVAIMAFSLSTNEVKERLCRDTDPALSNLLQVLKFIIAEAAHIYPLTSSSSFSFPRTNELGSLDFFLEILKELVSSTADAIAFPNNQIITILEDLVFLRSFLENIVEQRNKDGKLQDLWSRIMKVAYGAELQIDFSLLGDTHEPCLEAIAGDIHLMKIEAEEICGSIRYDGETERVTKTTNDLPSQVTTPISNEVLVGLNDEIESIIDRLVRGSGQLDIISVVGMPGLGKTSLANKLYFHCSIVHCFHIRGWCCFSQVYTKHSLLVQILCSIHCESSAQYLKKSEDDVAEELRKLLKGQRYLIIFDDVWDIEGWDLLKHSLPDDCNGSRILLTSRFQKLPLQIKLDSEPHHLRKLTAIESCELLQKKLFAKEDCPPTLSEVLLHVAKYCKGLPLAVVLVAGILATTEQDYWEEVCI